MNDLALTDDLMTGDFTPTPTNEQQTIIDYEVAKGKCLKIVAYAGTGKTWTFVEYAKARPGVDMLYLAFNKSVEIEAKRKFGPNVVPKTVHALAYREIGYRYKDNLVAGLKVPQLCKLIGCPTYTAAVIGRSLENYLNSADDAPSEAHVIPDDLGILKVGYESEVIRGINLIFNKMQLGEVPMTHSGYLKMYQLSRPRIPAEFILLDEAQDTNLVTHALVLDQLQYGTRVLLCGDPYQQIYAWRGAQDAMAKVECHTLHLTKSFRFGENIARVANTLLDKFFGEEIPLVGTEQEPSKAPKTSIICRTNSGLFLAATAYQNFAVVGEPRFIQLLDDILDLHRLYRGMRPRNWMFTAHGSWQKLYEYAKESLDTELQIKAAIVTTYGSELPALVGKVRSSLTGAQDTNHILVTGHQAKGLEWSDVVLAPDFPTLHDVNSKPKKSVKVVTNKETEIAQEEVNLLYVACTRAKNTLHPGSSIERLVRDLSKCTPHVKGS
jgi:hypothetical protein